MVKAYTIKTDIESFRKSAYQYQRMLAVNYRRHHHSEETQTTEISTICSTACSGSQQRNNKDQRMSYNPLSQNTRPLLDQ